MQLSLELGFFKVEMEIDYQFVVNVGNSHRRHCSYLAYVISDLLVIS